MTLKIPFCFAILLAFAELILVEGDERSQRYTDGEKITLWVNKVGPFVNPQETYSYYSLPFCKVDPDKWETRWSGLGEALEGNALVKSDYTIRFKKPEEPTLICSTKLDTKVIEQFRAAVDNHYWYNFVFDELPIWGMVGHLTIHNATSMAGDNKEYSVYTHKKFSIAYNEDRVIEVNVTDEKPQALTLGAPALDFTYSVEWTPTTRRFSQRFNRYLDHDFFEHQIHWFSIFNSFMMVMFLIGLVTLILFRTLKNDYQRYSRMGDDEDPVDPAEETGWKQVQGDVFRFPPYYPFFCAMVGTGIQLILMVYLTTALSIAGTLYIGRGSVSTAALLVYAMSSFVGGYVSASHYVKQSKGSAWIKTMVLTAGGFSGLCVLVVLLLNMVAVGYNSLAAIPFGTMVVVVLIWVFVSCPLVLAGTLVGRNFSKPFAPPCRVSQIPRQIPEKKWYLQR
mmetsp:Transcript_14348/g.39213  ORF Transcript_14348/g.39213 Transcript_14348/m.39213 type:complete len:451 (+) Transcript_14348:76-1428(+)